MIWSVSLLPFGVLIFHWAEFSHWMLIGRSEIVGIIYSWCFFSQKIISDQLNCFFWRDMAHAHGFCGERLGLISLSCWGGKIISWLAVSNAFVNSFVSSATIEQLQTPCKLFCFIWALGAMSMSSENCYKCIIFVSNISKILSPITRTLWFQWILILPTHHKSFFSAVPSSQVWERLGTLLRTSYIHLMNFNKGMI